MGLLVPAALEDLLAEAGNAGSEVDGGAPSPALEEFAPVYGRLNVHRGDLSGVLFEDAFVLSWQTLQATLVAGLGRGCGALEL